MLTFLLRQIKVLLDKTLQRRYLLRTIIRKSNQVNVLCLMQARYTVAIQLNELRALRCANTEFSFMKIISPN